MDCLKRPIEEGIRIAGSLKLQGVQAYATGGPFSHAGLSSEDKVFF